MPNIHNVAYCKNVTTKDDLTNSDLLFRLDKQAVFSPLQHRLCMSGFATWTRTLSVHEIRLRTVLWQDRSKGADCGQNLLESWSNVRITASQGIRQEIRRKALPIGIDCGGTACPHTRRITYTYFMASPWLERAASYLYHIQLDKGRYNLQRRRRMWKVATA